VIDACARRGALEQDLTVIRQSAPHDPHVNARGLHASTLVAGIVNAWVTVSAYSLSARRTATAPDATSEGRRRTP